MCAHHKVAWGLHQSVVHSAFDFEKNQFAQFRSSNSNQPNSADSYKFYSLISFDIICIQNENDMNTNTKIWNIINDCEPFWETSSSTATTIFITIELKFCILVLLKWEGKKIFFFKKKSKLNFTYWIVDSIGFRSEKMKLIHDIPQPKQSEAKQSK